MRAKARARVVKVCDDMSFSMEFGRMIRRGKCMVRRHQWARGLQGFEERSSYHDYITSSKHSNPSCSILPAWLFP